MQFNLCFTICLFIPSVELLQLEMQHTEQRQHHHHLCLVTSGPLLQHWLQTNSSLPLLGYLLLSQRGLGTLCKVL